MFDKQFKTLIWLEHPVDLVLLTDSLEVRMPLQQRRARLFQDEGCLHYTANQDTNAASRYHTIPGPVARS